MSNTIGELQQMGQGDAIFVIGSNTTECHPIVGVRMLEAKERGARLIVADPREIELTRFADVWLQQKPGTDIALLNAMACVILTEGLADEAFIAARTENFDAARETFLKYTPEYAEPITGVPAAKIRQAARLFAQAENAATYYTMGITQHTKGVDNVLAVANLALLTGNLGKPKAGVNPLRGQNNVQGACDMGALPNVLTGYQPVADAAVRARFEQAWGVTLSDRPGLTLSGALHAIEEEKLKVLYIMGENPMRSDPDITHVKHCLEHVDFLVVQDIFLTETAELADVVLPGTTWAEKDGTFTSTERRVQRIRQAVAPVGEARPDWRILTDLMAALGYPAAYGSPREIFDELRSVTPSYAGITYERLERGGIHWPCPTETHPGTPMLHVGKFSRGLGRFSAVEHRPPAEVPDAEYPLVLTTGRVAAHYHTATQTRRSWGLNGVHPEDSLEINPKDAERLEIADGDRVRVTSRRGSLTAPARVTDRVPVGVTFMTFHFSETPVNLLTNSACDPATKTPEYKVCAVRVEPLRSREGERA